MCLDDFFVFKTNFLNHWAIIKDNISDWKKEFCELPDEVDHFHCKFLELSVSDVIKERDEVSLNCLSVPQMLTKYFKICIIKTP